MRQHVHFHDLSQCKRPITDTTPKTLDFRMLGHVVIQVMLTFKGVATYVTYKIANVRVYKGMLVEFVFGAECLVAYVAFKVEGRRVAVLAVAF